MNELLQKIDTMTINLAIFIIACGFSAVCAGFASYLENKHAIRETRSNTDQD